MSCGCNAPVVYSYTYASPCAAPMYYAAPPMYVVNQGPAYSMPVPIAAEPTPAYGYPYVGATTSYYGAAPYYGETPYYGDVYPRMHRRHWASRYGYEGPEHVGPGFRPYGRRVFRPHIGRFHAERLHHMGPRFAHVPYGRINLPHHMRTMPMHVHAPMHVRPLHGPAPGYVHPRGRKPY